jgi:hypothetical protein
MWWIYWCMHLSWGIWRTLVRGCHVPHNAMVSHLYCCSNRSILTNIIKIRRFDFPNYSRRFSHRWWNFHDKQFKSFHVQHGNWNASESRLVFVIRNKVDESEYEWYSKCEAEHMMTGCGYTIIYWLILTFLICTCIRAWPVSVTITVSFVETLSSWCCSIHIWWCMGRWEDIRL